jgi:hypothetical protein
VPITFLRHLAAVSLPAMLVVSLSQLMSASPLYEMSASPLYDQMDLGSDATSDILGVAVPVDPNLSMPKKSRAVRPTSQETASLEPSDDESDFTDALASPLTPWDRGSSVSKDSVFSGLASGSVGSSSYVYAAHDSGDIAPKVVPSNLVASFPAFDLPSSSSGKTTGITVDDSDSSGNSNEPLTTGGDWEAPWRRSVVPSSGFGSPVEDLLAGSLGIGTSRNGSNYGFYPGPNGYFGDTGATGITTDLLDRGQKDRRLGSLASTAEPEGAGIAVIALILIFVAFYRRSSRRAARPW